jgi:RNA polymerase sigma-70 factor, ECF subfamily
MKEPVRQLWEQALVLRCQAGDDRAFEELVFAFHERLRNYVDRVLGNPGDAEDVLQEVWFDVYRKLPSLRSPRAIRRWLFTIARNKNAHHFRRNRMQMEPVEVTELADRSEPEPTFRDEDLRLISQCVAELSTEHREAVVLRYMEGMSYEDIARVADCPVGTVRSRLHYAKRVLKEEMKRFQDDTP